MSKGADKQAMIELVHVTKTYQVQSASNARGRGLAGILQGLVEPRTEKRVVVNDLSLEVREGELLALLGGSGSGKTTTLKMINRLIEPDEDGRGKILIGGEDITHISKSDAVHLRRKIGYVIQSSGLFPHMTVAANIAVVPRLLGLKEWPKDRLEQRIDELLKLVKLDPALFRNREPEKLSGGQKQRVGFARALAAEPKIVLLDEPFGALDPETREGLQKDFRSICKAKKLTAVMVTHDMTEALLMADKIAVMQDGRVLGHGTPQEMLASRDETVKRFINSPRHQAEQVEALLAGNRLGEFA